MLSFRKINTYKSRVTLCSTFARTYSSKPSAIITMPSLSPSMDAGKIVVWKVKVGDQIKAGDSIAEIETDKSTLSFDTTDDGYIAKILFEAGASVPVGNPIALVADSPGDIAAVASYNDAPTNAAPSTPTPSAPSPSTPAPQQTQSAPSKVSPPPTTSSGATNANPSASQGASRSSPYARTVSKELGVNLGSVKGTGPDGRIIAQDVIEAKDKQAITAQRVEAPPVQGGTYVDIANHNIRRITAERLTYSKQSIPHYYLTMECKADKLMALRAQLNDGAKDFKLSVNDFVIKAAALALQQHPVVNSEWKGDFIRQYSNVDINVAVNSPKGLLVPMIKDANFKGLKSISNLVKELAGRAQEGKSTPSDLQMGTFSISNLGMFGVSHFTAVINPPQAAILAVGNIDKRVELTAEGPKSVGVMTVTLSCDHRVIDGATGAQWLQTFKDLIENPIKLLL